MQTSDGAAPNNLGDFLRVLATKQLDVQDMITHRLPLSEAQEGFRLMAEAGRQRLFWSLTEFKFVRDKKQHKHTHYHVTRVRRD
jgi:hypothetical protein